MRLRWPFMLKVTHTLVVEALKSRHDRDIADQESVNRAYLDLLRAKYQIKVNQEYRRARDEGIGQVHAWAVQVNYAVFHGQGDFTTLQRNWVQAALQDAERQFHPTRTQLEAPSATTQGEH